MIISFAKKAFVYEQNMGEMKMDFFGVYKQFGPQQK